MNKAKVPGAERLKLFVERIARLHEERKAITADIADVVSQAKGAGYIPKTLRKVVARYLADPAKLAEDDALLETYEAALGRVGRALQAVRDGATWDEASKAEDVPRATLARAAAVSKQREMIPEENAAGQIRDRLPVGDAGGRTDPAVTAPQSPLQQAMGSRVQSTPPQPDDNTTERPPLQEVVASDPRPEGAPIPDDLAFSPFLDRRVST